MAIFLLLSVILCVISLNDCAPGNKTEIFQQNFGTVSGPVVGNGAIGKRQVIQAQNWGNIGGGGGAMPGVPPLQPAPSFGGVIQGQNSGAISGSVSGSNFAIGKRQVIQGQNWGNIGGGGGAMPGVPAPQPAPSFGGVIQGQNWGAITGGVSGTNFAIGRREIKSENKTSDLKQAFQGFMMTNLQGPVVQNQNKQDINHTVSGSGFAIGKRQVIQGQNWGNIGGGGGAMPGVPAPQPAPSFGGVIQGQNWGGISGSVSGSNFAIGKRQVIQGQNWGNIGGGGGAMPGVPPPQPASSFRGVIQAQNSGAISGSVSGSNFAIGRRNIEKAKRLIQTQNFGGQLITQTINDD